MAAPTMGMVNNWSAGTATGLLGLNQYYKGKKLAQGNIRPEATIPPEIYQNLSQAQLLALQGMPEQTKQEYINSLMRSQSYGLSQLGSRSAGLQGVVGLNQNANDSMLKLSAMDAQQRLANQGELMKQRQNLADYKQQLFQINKLNPYYETQARAEGLMGAGMQNVASGYQIANSGSSNAPNPYTNKTQENYPNSMYNIRDNRNYRGGDIYTDQSGYNVGESGSGWFNFNE